MIFDKSTPFNDIETNRVNCCADMGNKRRAINDKASSTQLSPSVYNRHCNFLTQTKVAVKRCMEEAATKKLIYIDSSTVNVLCGAVENCVLDSLQRRTIGLFEDLHSTALLKKISKECDAAASIINKMKSFSDSTIPYSAGSNGRFFPDNENLNPKSQNTISLPNTFSGLFTRSKPEPMKYLWIKMALLEKKLVDIMDYLIEHHMSFYDETSIMSSSLSGSLLIELIAGPCSLDFSLVKPSDHLWTDPDASELLDRHNIHSKGAWANHLDRNIYKSGLNITRSIKNRPNLKIQHHTSPSLRMQDVSTNCTFGNIFTMTGQPVTGNVSENKSLAKDYVESLHQNMKNVLLYGKNNVIVQPKDDLNEMQGYLSLHQTFGDKLRLKWTPNQLMNYQTNKNIEYENDNENLVYQENNDIPNQLPLESPKLLQWDSALLIKFENIVYLHVHQNEDKSGKVTLVCQDGVQYPPIRFPSGGHLLQFLTCLESGLSPAGKLEPPLLQIDDGEKSFPKLTRRRSNCSSLSDEDKNKYKTNKTKGFSFFESFNKSLRFNSNSSVEKLSEIDVLENDECIQSDFVFRIVYEANSNSTGSGSEINHDILNSSAESQNRDKNYIQWNLGIEGNETNVADSLNDSLTNLCSIMKRQILSRAFYGWLHYYRNLKTVRTQCNTLVHPGSVQSDVPCDASEGLTVEIWDKYKLNKDLSENELYRLIYFGGCAESLRNEVWPRMLGHYEWSSIDNSEIDSKTELLYEKSLSLWKAIEVIIKQRENEIISPLAVNNEEKNQLSSSHQTEMDSYTPCEPSMTYIATSRRRGSTITISNCDLTPSIGFYSTDNSFDATSSNNQDIAFQEDQLVIMADNMHRIDKDVDRCDRNYHYFSSNGQYRLKGSTNLKKLRNIMITWVWENIEIGYVQGMCDILAPLLVILDNEALTHACFTKLMKRMIHNFPQMGSNMDENLRTMALLLQIIDGDLYDHMCHDGEVTSLYVTYRWFLLDFKRELCYSDVFSVWETIWSAGHVASSCFNLFLALSLLYYYRDIILDNNMEYTDIIKFFNEMAEKHQVQKLLYIAREFIETIRELLKPR